MRSRTARVAWLLCKAALLLWLLTQNVQPPVFVYSNF